MNRKFVKFMSIGLTCVSLLSFGGSSFAENQLLGVSNESFDSNYVEVSVPDSSVDNKNYNLDETIENVILEARKEGVSEEKIEGLVNKLKNGEPFDSYKEEFKDIEPQIVTDNYRKTIYPDGSFVIDTFENVNINDVNSRVGRAINTKRGLKVRKNTLVVDSGFTMDYQVNTSTKKVKVLSVYNIILSTLGGTYKNKKIGYWNDWRSESHGWLSFDAVGYVGGSQGYCWIKSYVTHNKNWMTYNYS